MFQNTTSNMYYRNNFKITSTITPGSPKNPTKKEVIGLIIIVSPKFSKNKLKKYNAITPTKIFISNFTTILTDFKNIPAKNIAVTAPNIKAIIISPHN